MARAGAGVGRRAGVVLALIVGFLTLVVVVLTLVVVVVLDLALIVVVVLGVVVVDSPVVLGVIATAAMIVVLVLALLVRVVVLGDLDARALGIARVLGLVTRALDVDHRGGGRVGARAAVPACCDRHTGANGQHRGEDQQELVDGVH